MHFTKSSYYLYLYSTSPVILQTKKRNPLPLQNLRKQKLVILRFLRPVNTQNQFPELAFQNHKTEIALKFGIKTAVKIEMSEKKKLDFMPIYPYLK